MRSTAGMSSVQTASILSSLCKVCYFSSFISILCNFPAYSMEDTFFQWFHVTVLHLWMLSCRLTLEPDEKYLMYRQHLLKLLWNDVEQRMPLYFEKSEVYRFKRKINIHLYECLMTAYAELDEVLLLQFFLSDYVKLKAVFKGILIVD